MKRERNDSSLQEDHVVSTAQLTYQKEDISVYQNLSATASEIQQSKSVESQLSQLVEKTAAKISENTSAIPSINSSLMQAMLIYKEDPIYPEKAKSSGLSESVRLDLTINEKGAVIVVDAVRGNPVFADAAAAAVRQWRYEPVLIDSIPTAVSFSITITFRADETVSTRAILPTQLAGNYVNFITDNQSDTSVRVDPIPVGTHMNHENREYYSITSEMSVPIVKINKQQLQETAYAGWTNDDSLKDIFTQPVHAFIFINERGGIDGIRQAAGPRNPAFEKELMNLSIQSPAGFSGKAVPSWFMLTIDVPDYIR